MDLVLHTLIVIRLSQARKIHQFRPVSAVYPYERLVDVVVVVIVDLNGVVTVELPFSEQLSTIHIAEHIKKRYYWLLTRRHVLKIIQLNHGGG